MAKAKEPAILQFIFTFHTKKQVISNNPYFKAFITSPEVLMAYAISCLNDTDDADLVKISCCVYGTEDELPDWYMKETSGKFWLDDLEKFKKANGIKSTVPKAYILDWMKQNA